MSKSEVRFISDDLEKIYNDLPETDPVKKGIKRAIEIIKGDCQAGENAKKDSHILKTYKEKFEELGMDINNIRIYDLPLYYRLIYTLVPSPEKIGIIFSIILDWKTHKDYDKLNR
ncbi:MAG: hypothetical protein Q7R52_03620 [archaeon]|nr:hypothetical protein [archaeon]